MPLWGTLQLYRLRILKAIRVLVVLVPGILRFQF